MLFQWIWDSVSYDKSNNTKIINIEIYAFLNKINP